MSKPIIRMNAADLSNPNFGPAPADYIIEGEPIESAHEYYEKDGCAAGVWVCSPGQPWMRTTTRTSSALLLAARSA